MKGPLGVNFNNGMLHLICSQAATILLFSAALVFSARADTIIAYQAATNGTTGSYLYFASGLAGMQPCADNPTLECSDEIAIDFDPSVFSSIANGQGPAGFSILLLQPDNPPQSPGDFIALAEVANPLWFPFSVDFTLTGAGPPGPQTFSIIEVNSSGFIDGVAQNPELTIPYVPEPGSVLLAGAVIAFGSVFSGYRIHRLRVG